MENIHLDRTMIIITGPTASGKSDFSVELSKQIPSEIINMDMGQMYAPLTIGTAKPDWSTSPIKHHLFDIIDTPRNYTVVEYRKHVLEIMEGIWDQKKIPIVVGGSSFYLKSLFFPPDQYVAKNCDGIILQQKEYLGSTDELWQALWAVDPVRAEKINKNDRYRIERALQLWKATGRKPSDCVLRYIPPARYILLYVTRDRSELYQRIDARVLEMLHQGWLEEVRGLIGTEWCSFIQNKKIIGYNELIDFLMLSNQSLPEYEAAIVEIQKRSRHYAKRQETFWRSLKKQLIMNKVYHKAFKEPFIKEINLSHSDQAECIKTLLLDINKKELSDE